MSVGAHFVAVVPCAPADADAALARLAAACFGEIGFCLVAASSGRSAAEAIRQSRTLEAREFEGWLDEEGRGYGRIRVETGVARADLLRATAAVARVILWLDEEAALIDEACLSVLVVPPCREGVAKAQRVIGSALERYVARESLCALIAGDEGGDAVIAELGRRWGIAVHPLDETGCRRTARSLNLHPSSRVSAEIRAGADASDGGAMALKRDLVRRLSNDASLKKMAAGSGGVTQQNVRDEARRVAMSMVSDIGSVDLAGYDRQNLAEEVVEEAVGLGPIEKLMDDPDISEIMVNGSRPIFVERNGSIEATTFRFSSDDQVMQIIERIIAPLGRRIDERTPLVDARLADGSRVNAIVPPLALDGPTLTVRRFVRRVRTLEALVACGSMTPATADFLTACVRARVTIAVSGGTGTGKTTMLNALAAVIDDRERIITIEDAAELDLGKPHVVRLEARPPNLEGAGGITIRDLVRNALRMRPDRIIVGECRGGEALDMLQAMNTGHDGSLTTVHANNARDALSRLETMVLFAGVEMPLKAVREQIASSLDMIVQLERFPDGLRRVVEIAEVVGMEGDIITTQEIARYRRTVDGVDAFESSGFAPRFAERCAGRGIVLPRMV